jgi:archaellum component FlaF (FlaF/FlaG flagellin family)
VLVRASDGVQLDQTQTANGGQYQFTNRQDTKLVPSATYTVQVSTPPVGLQLTTFNVGSNAFLNSQGQYNGVIPQSTQTVPAGSSSNQDFNFGFVPSITFGHVVFQDVLNDGCYDANDVGIAGVTIVLYQVASGGALTQIAHTTTAADGTYSFSSLNIPQIVPTGNYVLSIPATASAISGQAVSKAFASGCDDAHNSKGTPGTTGFEIPVSPGGYVSVPNNDWGFVLPMTIGDYVWSDAK